MGRQAGRQAGRQVGRQAHRQADRHRVVDKWVNSLLTHNMYKLEQKDVLVL